MRKSGILNSINATSVWLVPSLLLSLLTSCATEPSRWDNIKEEGAFLVFRRQSQIGEETYRITSNKDSIIVQSLQGENERGRITGVISELYLSKNLVPISYSSQRIAGDTTNILKVEHTAPNTLSIWEKNFEVVRTQTPKHYFPLHSNIPAGIEMMLYHYYFKHGGKDIPTLPRGTVSITHTAKDTITLKGAQIILDRYVTEGINWGGRTVWLDSDQNLVALVKANTQIREMVRKGYEEALPTFIAGNVREQMNQLASYTKAHKEEQAQVLALVGGDILDGLSETVKEDRVLIIADGRIKAIGSKADTEIPAGAKVIDVTGKTLMPGLWDMHAHSNQVQWAPAYLAGGVTTIRDNGNELEFATAFRDAIAKEGALGPDILLAGMTDGPGIKGNGVVRARSVEEAKETVAMYHKHGYKQIKIYSSIAPEIMKVLCEEAHKLGMTATGHVPRLVGNAILAIEGGMDMLSHRSLFLTALFPDSLKSDLSRYYLADNDISDKQIKDAIDLFLKHGTVLDATIALDLVRTLPRGVPGETVEPDIGRIAYELFEGKRFRSGLSDARSQKAKADYTKAMEILGKFHKAGIPIVAGTDNIVPVFSLYLEIETYHKLGGLSPLEAIQTATSIPAKAMGMGAETGTLELGKQADIAILEKNPLEDISNIRTVSAVISNGNYYKSEPLWKAADFKPTRN